MREVVCTLDLGTTQTKAALVDEQGATLSFAGRPAPPPHDDGCSFDANEALDSALAVVRQVLNRLEQSYRLNAVSVTNQRATIVPVDDSATPVGPGLSWQDTRCAPEAAAWFDHIGHERFISVTGLPPSTLWSVGKLLWLRDNHAEIWRQTQRVALLHDLMLARLGCEELFTDPSNASETGLFDLGSNDWSEELLDRAGFSRKLLPVLRPSGTVVGKVSPEAARRTGLPPGLPLIVGGGDQQCASLGIGVTEPGDAGICLGTAAVLTCPLDRPIQDPKGRYFCTAHALPHRFLLEGIHNTFGSALAWVQQVMGLASPQELDRLAQQSPTGSRGMIFLPHLAGIGSPDFEATARGRLIGLNLSHTRPDMARAACEGVAFEMRRILDNIATAVSVKELRVTGGGAVGSVLPQLLADVTGRMLRLHTSPEATLQGAALLAWHGVGHATDLAAAARGWRADGGTLRPNDSRALREAYERYLSAVQNALAAQ